jgi:regulator of replication initiation timing
MPEQQQAVGFSEASKASKQLNNLTKSMTKGQLVQSLNSLLEENSQLKQDASTDELKKALAKLLGVGDEKLTLVENNKGSGFTIKIKDKPVDNDILGRVLKAFNKSSAEADSTLSARGGLKLPSRETFASAQNEVDRLLGQFGLKVPALKG